MKRTLGGKKGVAIMKRLGKLLLLGAQMLCSLGLTLPPAEAQEEWDARTEAIGHLLLIGATPELEMPAEALEAKQELRRWIATLPAKRRSALRTAAEAFANALAEEMREMVSAAAAGHVMEVPGPKVEAFVSGFRKDGGLMAAWKTYQAQWPPMKAELERKLRRTPLSEPERARGRQESQSVVETAVAHMRATLDDLFGKPIRGK